LIERYQSGTDTFLFRNRGLAEIRGVEVEGSVALHHDLAIEMSGQLGRGRADDNGTALDDVGPARAILQVRQAIGARVFVSGRVAAIARDSSPGPSEVTTPGYVDAGRHGELARKSLAGAAHRRGESAESAVLLESELPRVLAPGRYGTLTVVLKY
jgi:hypothetical protein